MPTGVGGCDNGMSWEKKLGNWVREGEVGGCDNGMSWKKTWGLDQPGKRDCSGFPATELEMRLGRRT